MKKHYFSFLGLLFLFTSVFGQGKILIGIVPFTSSDDNGEFYIPASEYEREHPKPYKYTTDIQDAVSDAFVNTKRFTLVERDKMDQITSERNLQKSSDFIDGSVVQQSAALGVQYLVLGNITKAHDNFRSMSCYKGASASEFKASILFTVRVVDVSTGEIMASTSFSADEKGRNAFDKGLDDIRPDLEDFIKKNFTLTLSMAQVETKDVSGAATKVLIAGGSAFGLKVNDVFKVYEDSELEVDGKKVPHKITLGKITVTEVQDENFSECNVTEGGADIASKAASGSKIKCEKISQ
ncbi:MAG TPA: CsgG/HfaB family protein [Bacteroidia bacterium]|nr:CsgG/HfaB family protein [Bacteroidia bacterium]